MKSSTVAQISTILATTAVLVLAHIGCTEKVTPPAAPPMTGPVLMRPITPDSVQSIFTASCALSNCHDQATAQQGQILDADSSYARNVNVFSQSLPTMFRIAPGDTANSFLILKITNRPGIVGPPMPLGNFPLPTAQQRTIINWVASGAPADSVPADSSVLAPRPLPTLLSSGGNEYNTRQR